MFKLKINKKPPKEYSDGDYLHKQFQGIGRDTIFTLLRYETVDKAYLRNDGPGTPCSEYYRYTKEQIDKNIKDGNWIWYPLKENK